jgi:hypothetical protein
MERPLEQWSGWRWRVEVERVIRYSLFVDRRGYSYSYSYSYRWPQHQSQSSVGRSIKSLFLSYIISIKPPARRSSIIALFAWRLAPPLGAPLPHPSPLPAPRVPGYPSKRKARRRTKKSFFSILTCPCRASIDQAHHRYASSCRRLALLLSVFYAAERPSILQERFPLSF